MHLRKLRFLNFKNYTEARLELKGNIQAFFGRNGSGKTNLLDAIHYLSFTKSALNPSDAQHVKQGENQFFISGEFLKGDKIYEVTCAYQTGQKKIVSEDGQPYAKFSKHIGKYPLVLIAPNDIELIWEGSEFRRKFFDNLLSQLSAEYLENLIIYTQYLKQRNGLLRIFSEQGNIDNDMLEVYDQKLIPAGLFLAEKRKALLKEFHPLFENHYRFLVGDSAESVEVVYRTGLDDGDFKKMLKESLSKDIILQRTTVGIHRDDFSFMLNGNELKRMGSQGQQKSFLIALKLAEFEIIARDRKIKPLLLLDDIFDKLDDERIHKLMLLVAGGTFGQLLITDARPGRSREIFLETGVKAQVFMVTDGKVVEERDQ